MPCSAFDVATYVLTYLEKSRLQRTLETFVNENPVFRTTDRVFKPPQSLEQVLEEYEQYKQTDLDVKQKGVGIVLNSLCDKLEEVCRQIRCVTGYSQVSNKVPIDQRARSRQANRNNRLKKGVTLSVPQQAVSTTTSNKATPQPDLMSDADTKPELASSSDIPGMQTPVNPMPSSLAGIVVAASDLVVQFPEEANQQAGSEPLVVEENQMDPFKSPKRKSAKPRRKEQMPSLIISASPHRVTVQESCVASESEIPGDIACLLDTLLETKELQERLADNINEGLGSSLPSETARDSTLDINDVITSEAVCSETVASIVEKTESDPAFHNLFSMLGLDIPSSLDGETTNIDSSDLVPLPASQSTLCNIRAIEKTETEPSDTPRQPSANNTCACPTGHVIRTITLKQPAHVRVLDFGGESTKEGSRDETTAGVNIGTRSVTSGLKRPTKGGEEKAEMAEAVKKPKTTERSTVTAGEFPSNFDVDSFLATLNYSK